MIYSLDLFNHCTDYFGNIITQPFQIRTIYISLRHEMEIMCVSRRLRSPVMELVDYLFNSFFRTITAKTSTPPLLTFYANPASTCGFLSRRVSNHYNDVIMGATAYQITSLTIVYSTVYSDADQRKYQSSASLAFVRGIHRGPVNSPHKWPVTRKMFPFDDVIMSESVSNSWL